MPKAGEGPLFTVLMPTHARPDVLGLAIASVLEQTERDFELLIVGDGVDDETRAVVAGDTDPRIRFFDLPKAPGFGYANRNIALATARGRLVAFAADDDLMLPDHLALMAEPFAEPAIMLAHSQAFWVSMDGIAAPDPTNLELADERAAFMGGANSLCAGTIVYRAGAPGPDPVWPDLEKRGDWVIWQRIIATHGADALVHLPVPTLMHFVAARKSDRASEFPRLRAWLIYADRSDWWPAALRVHAAEGNPPQAAYFDRLADADGLQALRDAAQTVLNRAARDRISSLAAGLRQKKPGLVRRIRRRLRQWFQG